MHLSIRNNTTATTASATAAAAELEGAAELAEQQNALTLTLEGRLENLSAEKQMLENQDR